MSNSVLISAQCDECARDLEIKEVFTNRTGVNVVVKPCEHCIEMAKSGG